MNPIKKTNKTRLLSILLMLGMVVSLLPITALAAPTTASVKDINLGTAGLANTGSKVYFGLDTSSTIYKVRKLQVQVGHPHSRN